MPPSRMSSFPTTYPSFLKHRFDDNPRSHSLKINLSIPTPLPAWASLPTPPMSGTPPPDPHFEFLQAAGRRRKREDTPPSSTLPESTQPVATTVSVSPLVEQTAHRHGESSRLGRTADPSMLPSSHMLPWDHTPSFVTGGGQGYTLVTSNLPPRPIQVSPRATRKVKAHVASACVNCKRKHLRCDESRPCRRCVQSAKEDTCKDVEHKKRGRPPLKDHSSDTSRNLHGSMSLPPIGSSSSRSGQAPNLVPLLPTPMPSRLPYAPSYAAPSIAQSNHQAAGQFSTQRPFGTFSMGRQPMMNFPQYPAPTTPQYGYGVQDQMPQQYRYAQPEQSPNMYQSQEYNAPLFSRRPVPSQPLIESTMTGYSSTPLQLPPILPVPGSSGLEQSMAHEQRQYQPHNMQYGHHSMHGLSSMHGDADGDERDPKRPKMDMRNILGPRE